MTSFCCGDAYRSLVVLVSKIACKQLFETFVNPGTLPPPLHLFCQIHRRCQFTELDGCARPKSRLLLKSQSSSLRTLIPTIVQTLRWLAEKAIRFLFNKFCTADEVGDKWGHVDSLPAKV